MFTQKIKYALSGAIVSVFLVTATVQAGTADGIFGDYFTRMIGDCGTNELVTGFDATPSSLYGTRHCTALTTLLANLNIFYNASNIGIGTSTPSSLLDLFATNAKLRIRDSGQVNGLEISQQNSDGGNKIFAVNNNYLAIGTNNTERARIDSIGNLGIGTSTPSASLEVKRTVPDAQFAAWLEGTKATNFGLGVNVVGTTSSTAVADFRAGNSSRMLIRADGNVGINTSAPSEKLEVNGNVKATAFLYSSDKRLKEHILPLKNSLEKILSLNGYSFDWKADGRKDIGVIAQEVETVFPDAVKTDKESGMKSVEYANLVAPLIESIKTQQQEIDALKSEVQELKARK